MKSFYAQTIEDQTASFLPLVSNGFEPSRARVAVYDAPAAAPRVEEVCTQNVPEYIESLSARVYELARSIGGQIPYSVIREVAENFIHAHFADPVVSILDNGQTIRFADRGPGITDKQRAMMPGFTTASGPMKDYIRGVGSGLPIVADFLSVSGGSVEIEDNLGSGSVITLRMGSHTKPVVMSVPVPSPPHGGGVSQPTHRFDGDLARETLAFDEPLAVAGPRLSTRQKQVLALILESGSAGPSIVSKELGVGLSTAYRDLASLEELSLIEADGGKRRLTPEGMSYLSELMNV